MAWTEEQRNNAAIIYRVGLNLGASLRDIQVALAAAIVESGLRNLDYGDRDSIGLFQQRDAWGSREARLDPATAARMFFLGGNAGQEGLLDIANREQVSIGALAQDVQVSAYPDRYGQVASEAGSLLKSIDPSADIAGDPGTLGAVPGIPPGTPAPVAQAPEAPSVTEVNGVGEVTADESGIGELTFGEGGTTPQGSPLDALTFGMPVMSSGERPDPSGEGGGSGGGGTYDPESGIYMPTLAELGIVQNADGTYTQAAAPSGGRVFAGTFAGKNPYDTTVVDGETIDYLTLAALEKAKEEFGGDFRMMQGGHSDYAASGNTHEGLGVVDVDVPNGDWAGAVAALRKIGFAAWVRNVPGYASAGSGAHIHAVLIGNEKLSPEAQAQVQSYLNNDNGLEGTAPDDGPRDFVNNRFTWGEAPKDDPEERRRHQMVKQAKGLLGTPYKWGGEDYRGLDDVGLVRKVYRSVDVDVPRLAFNLAYAAEPEPIESARLGDLIAWDNGERLGIYAGDGMVIHGLPGGAIQLNYVTGLGDAWSIPVPKLARKQAYSGPTGAYDPPAQQSAPPPSYSYDAPVSQAPTPSSGGGGGGNNGGSSNSGGDTPDPRIPDLQM